MNAQAITVFRKERWQEKLRFSTALVNLERKTADFQSAEVYNPDWMSSIAEAEKLGVTQIALFLSSLNKEARQKCYKRLSKIKNLTIPFVHVRSDMPLEEYTFLMKNFGTKKFNLHPHWEFPLEHDLKKVQDKIYVENSCDLFEKDLNGFAGICLDLSHLENFRMINPAIYIKITKLLKIFSVGANHISAITKEICEEGGNDRGYDCHLLTDFSQLNYLKQFPSHYFGEYMAIELVNSIAEQLDIIDYLKRD